MNSAPYSQELVFLAGLIGGFFLGTLWDFYRLIRYYIPFSSISTALGDILYWILSLVLGLNFIINISWGNIRFYILLSFLLGALLYFYLFSGTILKLCIALVDIIIYAIKKIYKILIFPIKFFIKSLINLLIPYKIKIDSKISNSKKKIKFHINRLKHEAELKKKQKAKKKKLKKFMREQRRNEQKFKKNHNAGKK